MSDYGDATALAEDQKQYRKLRKVLRQIEHLLLLPRALNDDERLKCAKRAVYRDQLAQLSVKYAGVANLLDESVVSSSNLSVSACQSASDDVDHDNDNSTANEPEQEEANNLEDGCVNEQHRIQQMQQQHHQQSYEKIKANDCSNEKDKVTKQHESASVQQTTTTATQKEQQTAPGGRSSNKQSSARKDAEEIKKTTTSEASKPIVAASTTRTTAAITASTKATAIKSANVKDPAATTKKPRQPPLCYQRILTMREAHADLILSADVSPDDHLLVTASRDTALKVWRTNAGGSLLHSFGGHTAPITHVRFWSSVSYRMSLAALRDLSRVDDSFQDSLLDEVDDEVAEQPAVADEDNATTTEKKQQPSTSERSLPLVVSSSLDCSLRLWSIDKGVCLKQFYLYNPVHHFDLCGEQFAVALDAGKIEYFNHLKKEVCSKVFADTEAVVCVKFANSDSPSSIIVALTQTGMVSVIRVSDHGTFQQINKADIFETLADSASYAHKQARRNFKRFELLDDSASKLLVINDNQPFVIYYDLNKQSAYSFISTSSSSYGFTSCFCKCANLYFVSAYNIDDAKSTVNVFEYESVSATVRYKYSLLVDEDSSDSHCISTLVCCLASSSSSTEVTSSQLLRMLVACSSQHMEAWTLCEEESTSTAAEATAKNKNKSRGVEAKVLKMNRLDLSRQVADDELSSSDESASTDDDHDSGKRQQQPSTAGAGKYCMIQ